MTNNYIIRNLRYTFNFDDDTMMKLFDLGGYPATRAEISDWLKKEDNPDYKAINDKFLATFLNGFITLKRGKKDGPIPVPEKKLNNNLILRKLKIALELKDTDMLDLFDSVDFKISKHELSAFFRKPNHMHYRQCKDQIVRNFLQGLQLKHRQE